MQINGPDGKTVKVTGDGRLRTYAGQESEMAFQSRVNGNAYAWSTSLNLGADKCLLWLRNDSDIPLIVDRIHFYGAAAAVFEIFLGSNKTTTAGTAVVGLNLNTSSANIADVTCTHTETGADAGGTLTLLETVQAGVTSKETIDYDGALVLGRLGEIAINIVTDITLASVKIVGYFQPVS